MRAKKIDSINMVPLIDVILVLLTITLATASFIHTGAIPVKLPAAESSSQNTTTSNKLEITIYQDGSVGVGSKILNLNQLKTELNGVDRSVGVYVMADRKSHTEDLVSVLDILKKLGFKNVSLKVEKK